MSKAYEDAKRAVLAREMEPCDPCAAYAEALIKAEIENRCDPMLNKLGKG